MSAKTFDVICIGGSLSGSTLACLLGRAGLRVAVCEKEDFPRRKVCGEGLSTPAWKMLAELGVPEDLPRATLDGYSVWKEGREHAFSPSDSSPAGYGIRRDLLDGAVMDAAHRESTVRFFCGTKVSEIDLTRDGVAVRAGNSLLRARYVVLADGANSVTAKRLRIAQRTKFPSRYGASLPVTVKGDLHRVGIFPFRGYEVYLTLVGDGTANLSLLGRRSDARAFFDEHEREMLLRKIRNDTGLHVEPFGEPQAIGPIGPLRRRPWFGRALLVGDCCESLDPVSGMGMTHAVCSAFLAANALKAALVDEEECESAFQLYAAKREALARPLRGYTRLVFLLLGRIPYQPLLSLVSRSPAPAALRAAALPGSCGAALPRLLVSCAGAL